MTTMWTIFDRPPGHAFFTAVRFEIDADDSVETTDDLFVGVSLDRLREEMTRRGLHKVEAAPGADPKIIELWMPKQ